MATPRRSSTTARWTLWLMLARWPARARPRLRPAARRTTCLHTCSGTRRARRCRPRLVTPDRLPLAPTSAGGGGGGGDGSGPSHGAGLPTPGRPPTAAATATAPQAPSAAQCALRGGAGPGLALSVRGILGLGAGGGAHPPYMRGPHRTLCARPPGRRPCSTVHGPRVTGGPAGLRAAVLGAVPPATGQVRTRAGKGGWAGGRAHASARGGR